MIETPVRPSPAVSVIAAPTRDPQEAPSALFSWADPAPAAWSQTDYFEMAPGATHAVVPMSVQSGDTLTIRSAWSSVPFFSAPELSIDWAINGATPAHFSIPVQPGVGVTHATWCLEPSKWRVLALSHSTGEMLVWTAFERDGNTEVHPVARAVLPALGEVLLSLDGYLARLWASGPRYDRLNLAMMTNG